MKKAVLSYSRARSEAEPKAYLAPGTANGHCYSLESMGGAAMGALLGYRIA